MVFAVRARWRWLTRWPAVLSTLAALATLVVARVTGRALLSDRPELAPLVRVHQQRATVLIAVTVVLTLLVLVAAWSLGGTSALASGRGARESGPVVLERALPVLLVLAAVAVLVWVVLTGDAGARAVWG